MKLCLKTDSIPELPFEGVLDLAVEFEIEGVEVSAVGGHTAAPHMRLDELLADSAKRRRFGGAISSRGLRLAAINCSASPLHPVHGDRDLALVKNAIRLAGELGVDTIVTMSGCPGDSPAARTMNWIVSPWPPEMIEIREEQWQLAIEAWAGLADFALAAGVERIALELHPLNLVYNVPTLLRMRNAVGPVIGANLDPSHLFCQGMDPVRVARALHAAVYHVHLKDAEIHQDEVALTGFMDPRPWSDPLHRSWTFRIVGHGHPASFWTDFFAALESAGFDGALSIENLDQSLPGELGLAEAVAFVGPRLGLERERQVLR